MYRNNTQRTVYPLAVCLIFFGVSSSANETTPMLSDVVVTATGKPESRSAIAGTIQVLDRERIEASPAKSLTDLLAENGVGFFSEWTPGQTSINLRGGASDGQGRDFRSQVLVLINGRRAGTANISKLSPADVERVEIVRGPSSVVYGSQNIGGIVNIITKNGRTAPGTLIDLAAGSSDLLQGKLQHGEQAGNADWYIGLSGGKKGDYRSGEGGGKLDNTGWERRGLTAALGYQLSPMHRLDVNLRSDGIYDAGFRGSAANIYSKDDRYNQSIELSYSGKAQGERIRWTVQGYKVRDVDNFHWASPIIRNNLGNPAPGTRMDHNKRQLDVAGLRMLTDMSLWRGNDLLLGWDWETSKLRSDRYRLGVPGNDLAQIAPYDNNQTEIANAFYFEDAQKLLDERLILRGGVRRTLGKTSLDWTPNLAALIPRSENYQQTTYSFGGTFKLTDTLGLRSGWSTGFRAPTASELAADFTALGGGRIFGNPLLESETSHQIEFGGTYKRNHWHLDVALFQNIIQDRIVSKARPGIPNTSDYVNNSGDIVVRGLELQGAANLLPLPSRDDTVWRWSIYGNGAYNFNMKDEGAATTANTDNVQRTYKYQAAFGTRFGQAGIGHDWSVALEAVLRGPMWYDTEENLLTPEAEPDRNYIHRKSPFTVINLRGDIRIGKGVKLYATIYNLFDINEHPILIGLDDKPWKLSPSLTNGGFGTSMPGREFQIGIRALF